MFKSELIHRTCFKIISGIGIMKGDIKEIRLVTIIGQ